MNYWINTISGDYVKCGLEGDFTQVLQSGKNVMINR